MSLKFSNKLTVADFEKYPVWEFTNQHEDIGLDGDLVVEPVRNLPVTTLDGRFVGTSVILANRMHVFAVLIGLDLKRKVSVSSAVFYQEKASFLFRRTAPEISGPEHLAVFLKLPMEEVFPIHYDISKYVSGRNIVSEGDISLDVPKLPDGLSRQEYLKKILAEKKRS